MAAFFFDVCTIRIAITSATISTIEHVVGRQRAVPAIVAHTDSFAVIYRQRVDFDR